MNFRRFPLLILTLWVGLFSVDSSANAALRTKDPMPEFLDVAYWENTLEPPKRKDFKDRIVYVVFCNFTDPTCLCMTPFLKLMYEQYSYFRFDLIMILTPDYEFEKKAYLVNETALRYDIQYPIALDAKGTLWRAYNVQKSPAAFLVDSRGLIRYTGLEKETFERQEMLIRDLLTEIREDFEVIPAAYEDYKPTEGMSPTMHFGSKRLSGYGNNETLKSLQPMAFKTPKILKLHSFHLEGQWALEEEKMHLHGSQGKVTLSFRGAHVHTILALDSSKIVPVEVKLNGEWLTEENKGVDIAFDEEKKSVVYVKEPQLYELVLDADPQKEHTLELFFPEKNAEVYRASFS